VELKDGNIPFRRNRGKELGIEKEEDTVKSKEDELSLSGKIEFFGGGRNAR